MSGPQARRVSGWARSLVLTPACRSSPLGQPRATDTEAARRARGAGRGEAGGGSRLWLRFALSASWGDHPAPGACPGGDLRSGPPVPAARRICACQLHFLRGGGHPAREAPPAAIPRQTPRLPSAPLVGTDSGTSRTASHLTLLRAALTF